MTDAPAPASASLLPANASLLEKGLDLAFAKLLARVEPPFPELMDPNSTPPAFLPYLAADRAVIGWEAAAPDGAKRELVAASWSTKRQAGTRQALRQALEASGFSPRFVPWHESGAQPYTLQIMAPAGGLHVPADYQKLEYRIEEAKSERDEVTVRIQKEVPLAQRLYVASVLRHATLQAVAPALPAPPPPSGYFFGGALCAAVHMRIEASNG